MMARESADRLKLLDLGTVGTLRGGMVGAQFGKALQRCIEDCFDRPGNESPRKIVMQLALAPVSINGTAGCDKVDVIVSIRERVPDHQINAHQARVRKQRDRASGKEIFTAVVGADPDDADQMTIGDDGGGGSGG